MKTLKQLNILILSFTVVLLISHKANAQATSATPLTPLPASAAVEAAEVSDMAMSPSAAALKNFTPNSPIAELNDMRLALLKAKVQLETGQTQNRLSEQEVTNLNASINSIQTKINVLLPKEQKLLNDARINKEHTNTNSK